MNEMPRNDSENRIASFALPPSGCSSTLEAPTKRKRKRKKKKKKEKNNAPQIFALASLPVLLP
jgi:hypothetical protein